MNTHTHTSQASAQSNETGYCLKSEQYMYFDTLAVEKCRHILSHENEQKEFQPAAETFMTITTDVLNAPLKTKHSGSLWKLEAAQKSPYFPTRQKKPEILKWK